MATYSKYPIEVLVQGWGKEKPDYTVEQMIGQLALHAKDAAMTSRVQKSEIERLKQANAKLNQRVLDLMNEMAVVQTTVLEWKEEEN